MIYALVVLSVAVACVAAQATTRLLNRSGWARKHWAAILVVVLLVNIPVDTHMGRRWDWFTIVFSACVAWLAVEVFRGWLRDR